MSTMASQNESNHTSGHDEYLSGNIDVSFGVTVFYCILMCCIVVSATFGNSLVITAVRRTRALRKSSAILVVNLACVDLAVTIAVVPFVIVTASARRWILPRQLCLATGFMNAFLTAAQIMALFLIGINRFIAVAYPHSYETRLTKKLTVIMVVLGWGHSLFWTLMPFYGWGELGFIEGTLFCNILWSHEISYAATIQVMCYFVPTILAAVLYSGIYFYIRKQSKQAMERTRSTLSMSLDDVDVTKAGVTQSKYNTGGSFASSLEDVTRNGTSSEIKAEKMKTKRRKAMENRVTRTLLGVVLAFAVCWFPRGVANLWALFVGREKVPRALEYASTAFVFLNSSVNPVLYGVLHQDFNRAFREILSCRKNQQHRSDTDFSVSFSAKKM